MTTSKDHLELFHSAPIYQVRRDIRVFRQNIRSVLDIVLCDGRSNDWKEKDIVIKPDDDVFQFFRRDYTTSHDGSFRWLSYDVDKLTRVKFKNIRAYFVTPEGRRLLGILTNYFDRDHEIQMLLRQLSRWLDDDPKFEDESAWVHQCLLRIYSSISTSGFLMSPIWEDRGIDDESAPAVAFLVHVATQEHEPPTSSDAAGKHSALPQYTMWKLTATGGPQWESEDWKDQANVTVTPRSVPVHGVKTLSRFFQEYLFPLFQYKKYNFSGPYYAIDALAKENVFGFLFLPVYIFHDFGDGGEDTVQTPHGEWAGVLQIKLFTKPAQIVGNEQRQLPSLSKDGVKRLVRRAGAYLDPMVEKLIESDAIRAARGGKRLKDAFTEGLLMGPGWTLRPRSSGDDHAQDGPIVRTSEGAYTVVMDWDSTDTLSGFRPVFDVAIPSLGRRTSGEAGRREEPLDPFEPRIYEICNRLYRSISTLLEARRNQENRIQRVVTELLDETQEWFDGNHSTPRDVPHSYTPECFADAEYRNTLCGVFPFIPDVWFEDNDKTKLIHGCLKTLCGKDGFTNKSGTSDLCVGGLYIFFLYFLHNIKYPGLAKLVEETTLSNLENVDNHHKPSLTKRADSDGYRILGALYQTFQEATRSKESQGYGDAIANIFMKDGKIQIMLKWNGDEIDEFFRSIESKAADIAWQSQTGSLMGCVMNLNVLAGVGEGRGGPRHAVEFRRDPAKGKSDAPPRIAMVIG